MEVKARLKDGVVVLDVYGAVDSNAALFVETVGQCLRDGYRDILCNFEEVNTIDYMGISVIVIAYKDVINNGGRMKFVNISVHLKSMFSISGIDRVVEIYPTEEIALNSFKEDKIIENIKKLQLRRRFRRVPIDIKVEMKEKYDSQAVCYNVDVLNLSAVGAYIFGCDKFRLGDKVALKIKLPPKSELMEVEAKVVWLPDKQVQNYLHPGMGVEFCNLPNSDQEKLVNFVQRNSPLMVSDELE